MFISVFAFALFFVSAAEVVQPLLKESDPAVVIFERHPPLPLVEIDGAPLIHTIRKEVIAEKEALFSGNFVQQRRAASHRNRNERLTFVAKGPRFLFRRRHCMQLCLNSASCSSFSEDVSDIGVLTCQFFEFSSQFDVSSLRNHRNRSYLTFFVNPDKIGVFDTSRVDLSFLVHHKAAVAIGDGSVLAVLSPATQGMCIHACAAVRDECFGVEIREGAACALVRSPFLPYREEKSSSVFFSNPFDVFGKESQSITMNGFLILNPRRATKDNGIVWALGSHRRRLCSVLQIALETWLTDVHTIRIFMEDTPKTREAVDNFLASSSSVRKLSPQDIKFLFRKMPRDPQRRGSNGGAPWKLLWMVEHLNGEFGTRSGRPRWFVLAHDDTFMIPHNVRLLTMMLPTNQPVYAGYNVKSDNLDPQRPTHFSASWPAGILINDIAAAAVVPLLDHCYCLCNSPHGSGRLSCCLHALDINVIPLSPLSDLSWFDFVKEGRPSNALFPASFHGYMMPKLIHRLWGAVNKSSQTSNETFPIRWGSLLKNHRQWREEGLQNRSHIEEFAEAVGDVENTENEGSNAYVYFS